MKTSVIKIRKPSIDDFDAGKIVIRGVVDFDSLPELKLDFYQRELLPAKSRREIREAILHGERLPDIVLGMRGETFDVDQADNVVLQDPVYIIDGRQRRDTILELCQEHIPPVHLGATIHLNTTAEWERQMFHKLNLYQTKVSPNILLRNIRGDHPGLMQLYGLTRNDKNFILHDRVCWQQNMARTEIITVNTMLHTVLVLHAHITGVPTRGIRGSVPIVDKLIEKIGLPIFRDNVRAYFNLIDECWGIKRVILKGGAPYLKLAFLTTLARLLSDHHVFWKQPTEHRFQIDYTFKRKLAKFPINDPEIVRLAAASGAARFTMYMHLLNHINSGKREENRLKSRNASVTFDAEEASIDEEQTAA